SEPAADQGQAAAAQATTGQRLQAPRRRSFKETRELERLDTELPLWESRRSELELLLASGGGDYTRIEGLTQELADLLERIAGAEERWLLLSDLAD
ncbi:MAG: ABC transporter C-terminal domain-containing protein, partial [Cyanobium sp.]